MTTREREKLRKDFESQSAREGARRKIVGAAKRHGIEIDPDSNAAKSGR
jgi:DNA repair photolyase